MSKLIILSGAMLIVTGLGAYLFGNTMQAKAYAYNNSNVNENGRMRSGLQDKATMLGLSLEELIELRDSGKTMLEIAQSKGISEEEFHQKMQDAAVTRWKDKGLSESEIQERLTLMKERQENCDGTPNNGGLMGQGNGRGRQSK